MKVKLLMSLRVARRTFDIALLCIALSLCTFAACGVTPGRPASVEVYARAVPEAGEINPLEFATATGWRVTLHEARIALGPLFVFGATDAVAQLRGALLPVARAHGGEGLFGMRPVLAELSEQREVDLARGVTSLGIAHGAEGIAVDATLVLDAPRGSLGAVDGPLRGHHLWVAGVARRDSEELAFEGGLDIPDEGTLRHVEGLALDALIEDGGRIEVGVHPRYWLDAAHFERLPLPIAEGAPRVITIGSQVRGALYLGARSADAFSLAWGEPNQGDM